MSPPPTSSTTLPTLASTLANYFDPSKSTVISNAQNDAWKLLAFGRVVSDLELAGLCGAPIGSVLTLSRSPAPTDPRHEQTPDGVKITVRNPAFFEADVALIFHALPHSKRGLYIKLVIAKKHPGLTNVAGLMLCRMLAQMDAVPVGAQRFSVIQMLAAGGRTWTPMVKKTGERWSGWVVWPKYGFDMPVAPITKSILPAFPHVPAFASAPNGCAKVSDLLSIDMGSEFWEVVGDGSYMQFDPTPGSSNRKTLQAFMTRKYR